MSRRSFTPNSIARAGAYTISKHTNMRRYNPWNLETDLVFSKISERIEKNQGIFYHQVKTHPDFVAPIKIHEAQRIVGSMPAEFVRDIDAVVLLGGTSKQCRSEYLRFGVYYSSMIFIHAFPKKRMTTFYKHGLRPNVLDEYRRAGARIEECKPGTRIIFDRQALRDFFLRDVLVHEIGHHIDRHNFSCKTDRKIEGFAEWFATEYGFRRRSQ